MGGAWAEEYLTGVMGIWAWDPEGHDWERTRGAIYDFSERSRAEGDGGSRWRIREKRRR